MSDNKEIRQFTSEVRKSDDSESNTITGLAAVYFRSDDPGTEYALTPTIKERIMPGAFSDALNDDVRVLFNHDANLVLGRTKNGTATIEEARRGLRYSADLPDTQVARDVYELISRGDVDQSSFGFYIKDESWREITNEETEIVTLIREINKVELFDASPVTFPAYESTTVNARCLNDSMTRHIGEQRIRKIQELNKRIRILQARSIARSVKK